MINNNFERMKIVLNMPESFDYDKFLRICINENVQPLSINEYAMKVGYLEMAKIKYPDMPIEEGYLKIVDEANNQQRPQPPRHDGQIVKTGCGSCGGGKTR